MSETEDNERVASFKHFPELALEIRRMITNKMGPSQICRYGGTSLLCEKEAKTSKNYIYSLEYHVRAKDHITIDVRHGNLKIHGETGYILEFVIEFEHFYMIYKNRKGQQLWWVKLNPSTWFESSELEDMAFKRFNELLTYHQRKIKVLSIKWDIPSIEMKHVFEIAGMKNLEKLTLGGSIKNSHLILKTPLFLKKLAITDNNYFPIPYDEICRVQKVVHFEDLHLKNEQFLQLTAPVVQIHIGQLTELDVVNFIRSWQNGTVGRKLIKVSWMLKGSLFRLNRFLTTFENVFERDRIAFKHGRTIEITHLHDARKKAIMKYSVKKLQVIFNDKKLVAKRTRRNPIAGIN